MKKVFSNLILMTLIVVLVMTSAGVSFAEAGTNTNDSSAANELASNEIKFIYVDSSQLEAPGEQNIAIVWNSDMSQIKNIRLVLENSNGVDFEIVETRRTDKSILFSRNFTTSEIGRYKVKSLKYCDVTSNEEKILSLADIDASGSFVIVDNVAETAPDKGVATVDVNINALSENQVSTQISDAIQDVNAARVAAKKNGPIVVVLDPGHGGSDPGACANGLREKDLTLKIAKYCKEELLKYAGVEVYMTRESDVSTPGADAGEVMDNLVKVGVDHNADIFVSIHINSGGGTGAEVWYPNNSSWKNEYHTEGGKLSDSILSEIVKLGLYNRGKKTLDYTQNGGKYYPDGSKADYYGVIRKSRLAGFPGIIVEHAFIDRASDAAFLSSEANLQKLGIADATGIAKHFGLEKGTWEKTAQGTKYKYANGTYAVGWAKINGYCYYFDAQGYMKTGWQNVSGKWYYLASSGYMTTGWQLVDNKWYYMASSGERLTGWQHINGKYYYLYPDGHSAINEKTPDGYYVDGNGAWIHSEWKKNSNGWWYDHGDGTFAKGWEYISGDWYYFNSYGYMKTGWQRINGYWYYMNSSGRMQVGWQYINRNWYYLGKYGTMATGWQYINGEYYYLYSDGHAAISQRTPDGYSVNANGVWLCPKWIKNSVGWWYRLDGGGYATGWRYISRNWYYFGRDGYMRTGWQYINGKSYYLYPDGHMASNEKTPDGFFVNASGAWIHAEWKKNSNGWWYDHGDGTFAKGWEYISGDWYYFDRYGYMKNGWQRINGYWYYMNSSGRMQVGWQYINRKWYYLGKYGTMATGWQYINGEYYYLYSDGHAAISQRTPDGYTVNANGVWLCPKWIKNSVGWWYRLDGGGYATGWKKMYGVWYYFGNDGYMRTGLQSIDGYDYYFDSEGYMKTGRQIINGHPHEFYADGRAYVKGWITYPNGKKAYCYGKGKLAVGDVNVDGRLHSFDKDGYLIVKDGSYENYAISGQSDVTIEKLMALYEKSSPIAYPNYYKNTDAPTLRDFCSIYIEEAKAENIKPEVAFCQSMLETGWLQFKGNVKIDQFNFAGLGAIGGSASGAKFSTVRIGIRAQIQHLKAYANDEPLKLGLVDPRFKYVKRGCAPYVEWLGIKDNPNGFGWAASPGYGFNIVKLIKQII